MRHASVTGLSGPAYEFELAIQAIKVPVFRATPSDAAIRGAGAGIVPLVPYMLEPVASAALLPPVIVTLVALAFFGYVKGRFTGAPALRSAAQTVLIGGLAAAFGIARLIA